jgi:hypothetical protein
MPVFQIERNGETYEVDAPDEASALSALGNIRQQPPQADNADVFRQGAAEPDNTPENVFDSAARGLGEGITFGAAPYIGGAVNYALQGGVPGSFDEGYQRSEAGRQRSEAQHPDAYGGGAAMGMALPGVIPTARVAQLAARQSPQVLGALGRVLMRVLGIPGSEFIGTATDIAAGVGRGAATGAKGLSQDAAASARMTQGMRGPPPGEPSAAESIAPNLFQALREGKFRTEGAPTGRPGPAPNARMGGITPEMQAKADAYQEALRRHALRSIEFPNQ